MCVSYSLCRLLGAATLLLLDGGRVATAASFRSSLRRHEEKEESRAVASPHDAFAAPPVAPGVTPDWVDNPLAKYFFTYTKGPVIWKWHHYFDVYHRHLQHFRGRKEITMVVIGVQSGGEIGMWKDYFGPGLKFYGVDINPGCKKLEKVYDNVNIIIGDQGDGNFLSTGLKDIVGKPWDIFIDDGSHINAHQILTFDRVFWHLNEKEGVYITEDITTSYSKENSVHRTIGGSPETFIEHMKKGVDGVNGWYQARDPGYFTKSVDQIHFYDGMVVTYRQPHPSPMQEKKGDIEIKGNVVEFESNPAFLLTGEAKNNSLTPILFDARGHSFQAREAFQAPPTLDGQVPEWVGDNPLALYFFHYKKGPVLWKWHHYFKVYHTHLQTYRGRKEINMLVLGAKSGGEIGMWQQYFGPGLKFYAVDSNPACKQLEKTYQNVTIITGNQGDPNFITTTLKAAVPERIDIIIDDGSHINKDQILSFDHLFWWLDDRDGTYIAEDVATSYSNPTSLYRRDSPETFVEHMKKGVDNLNEYYQLPPGGSPGYFTMNANQIHFYDSMVVIPRRHHPWPAQEQKGTDHIPYCTPGQKNGCLTL